MRREKIEKIIEILIERDGISREEAISLIKETYDAIMDDPDLAEDYMMDYLGLEMDYIFGII